MKQYKNQILAGVIIIALAAVSFVIVNGGVFKEKHVPKEVVVDVHDSDLVGATPQETALKFIYHNGTIGDYKVEATAANLKSGFANQYNGERRIKAYNLVESAILEGSPLREPLVVSFAKEYGSALASPVFYAIDEDSLRASEPFNEREVDVVSQYGLHKYKAVDIRAAFSSRKITFDRVKDASWDGTYTQIENKEVFEDFLITLTEVDGKWFVLYMPTAENEVNARFSTWQGVGKEKIDSANDFENGKIAIEGFSQ